MLPSEGARLKGPNDLQECRMIPLGGSWSDYIKLFELEFGRLPGDPIKGSQEVEEMSVFNRCPSYYCKNKIRRCFLELRHTGPHVEFPSSDYNSGTYSAVWSQDDGRYLGGIGNKVSDIEYGAECKNTRRGSRNCVLNSCHAGKHLSKYDMEGYHDSYIFE